MKDKFLLMLVLISSILFFEKCEQHDFAHLSNGPILRPDVENVLLEFLNSINPNDSASVFIILKNIDANTVKVYFVAKKPLRSDFEIIGMPISSTKINGLNIYIFSGLEKIIEQNQDFWDLHKEIFDDRKLQIKSLHETSILKKELYLLDNGEIRRILQFDDMIFVGNPVDTILFR